LPEASLAQLFERARPGVRLDFHPDGLRVAHGTSTSRLRMVSILQQDSALPWNAAWTLSEALMWRRVNPARRPESGNFTRTEARVPLTRAEGPAGNSPAREGGGLGEPRVRGPKDRHFDCAAPSALMVVSPISRALRPGLHTVGPYGPVAAASCRACDGPSETVACDAIGRAEP
jgi:hypothetical protein